MSQFSLKHYQEFKDVLDNYVISERANQILKDLKLVLLIGPTSGGRNTIIEHQLGTGKYYYIVSDTTRPPRTNDGVLEQNGKEYWFRDEAEMLADLKSGDFLEAELIHQQQVSGISIRELEKAKNEQKIAITDVDIEGIHNILKAKPDTVAIMLLPPSFDEWQRRLTGRGFMSPEEQRRRLETALKIFQDGLKQSYYHFIITENIEQSAGIIDSIAQGGTNPHQGRVLEVLNQLIEQLQNKLANPF